jgi:hypothetical protein
MSCNWNVEDVIIDETEIVLLDSLADLDPQSHRIEIKLYLMDLQKCDSQKVFQFD